MFTMDSMFKEEIAGSEDVFPGSEDVLIVDTAAIMDWASLSHSTAHPPFPVRIRPMPATELRAAQPPPALASRGRA
jgi:hypothetical protein